MPRLLPEPDHYLEWVRPKGNEYSWTLRKNSILRTQSIGLALSDRGRRSTDEDMEVVSEEVE